MPTEIFTLTSRYFFGVNIYLLKTMAGYFLIDTGISKKRDQLVKELQQAGCNPGDLKYIIITHGHMDHVGNAAYLKDRYRAPIAMHKEDTSMVESGDMFVDKRGTMIGIVRLMMRILGLSDYEKFTPDLYLEEGMDLSPHGLDASIIQIPGHSKGSIGVLTAEGDLFCGDLLTNTDKPAMNTLVDDPEELEASALKLDSLKIRNVYPGHGEPFSMEQFRDGQ